MGGHHHHHHTTSLPLLSSASFSDDFGGCDFSMIAQQSIAPVSTTALKTKYSSKRNRNSGSKDSGNFHDDHLAVCSSIHHHPSYPVPSISSQYGHGSAHNLHPGSTRSLRNELNQHQHQLWDAATINADITAVTGQRIFSSSDGTTSKATLAKHRSIFVTLDADQVQTCKAQGL